MKGFFTIIKNGFLLLIILMFTLNSTFLDVHAGAYTVSVVDQNMKGSLTIEKCIPDGQNEDQVLPVAGTEYQITYQYRLDGTEVKDNDCDYFQSIEATDEDGKAKFTELALGTYQVEEVGGVPAGYERSASFVVSLPVTNASQVTYDGTTYEAGTIWEYDIKAFPKSDPIYGAVQLTKYDSQSGEKLKGAVFQLYHENGEAYTTESGENVKLATDREGIIKISNLPFGTYYFEEIEAPKGYCRSKKKKYFSIVETYDETDEATLVKVSVENSPIETEPQTEPEPQTETETKLTLIRINPKTGDSTSLLHWLGALVAAAAVLAILRRIRHNTRRE